MSAPGENSPSKRDIVELELLLKRLYELQERADPVGDAEEGEVILSDVQQLNRMLSSLNALYRDGTPRDYQRFGGMTADDVDALAEILFELGRASDSKFPKCRSFFLTTGAWKRMYEVVYQLAPGPRGDAARAAARAAAEDQRQRRHEAAQREMERMVRWMSAKERPTALLDRRVTTTDFEAAVQVRDATVATYGEFVTPVRDQDLFEWVAWYPGLREVARRMAAVASDVFLRSAWEAAWWAADGEKGWEPPMVEADARAFVQEQLEGELQGAPF